MNAKIYNGNVQPNPKEFKIWVNDEGLIKTWNGTEWVESAAGGDGSGSGGSEEYSTIEYLDISQYTMDDPEKMLAMFSFSINTKISGITTIGLTGYLLMQGSFSSIVENTSYIEIDFNHIAAITSNGSFTVKEAIAL